MKRFHLTLSERGEKQSFETRAFIEIEADYIPQLLAQFILELSRQYELKVQDAEVKGRLSVKGTTNAADDDIPF
jgi:hypothetical protein